MSGVLRRVGDHALTLGALLGLAALLSATLGAALGVRPLFFRSGSMAPTIGTGSMALARSVPAADLRPGDVVSVVTASGNRVTHRVVGTRSVAGDTVLTLRGDANRVPDPETYAVDSAYRVFWHVPWVGYAVGAMLTPAGLFLLGVGVAGLLVLAGRGGAGRSRSRGGRRARRAPPHRHRARRAGATAVAAMAVVAGPAGPASAAPWTDPVTISGTTLTAGTVAAPTLSCGTLGILSVTFNWTAVSGATSYTLHYGSGGSSTTTTASTTITLVTAISGGTAWVEANHNYGSTTWTSVASNTRSYTVAVVSLCA
jgi:signal peptidase I